MEMILSWVKSGLLFGILASVVLMLSPNKSYQKHIGMVVGLLFILVMLHPVMEIFQVDGSTYAAYIRNFLMLETEEDGVSDSNRELYEESLNIQLMANFQESNYPVKEVRTTVDETGQVQEVAILFDGEARGLEKLELYLKNLFGEEVVITYGSR